MSAMPNYPLWHEMKQKLTRIVYLNCVNHAFVKMKDNVPKINFFKAISISLQQESTTGCLWSLLRGPPKDFDIAKNAKKKKKAWKRKSDKKEL